MKNCKYGKYDENSKQSIYDYALVLLDKSIAELYKEELENLPKEYFNNKGKGNIGSLVEKFHFGYEPNSNPEPDFPNANLELKTTSLKKVRDELVSKERLVLGMIDYFKVNQETFEQSSFIKKNASILLMCYLYEKGKLTEQIFKRILLWDLPKSDYPIIKQDWETIYQKIKDGKAEEISGGDTFYLEAARKGAGGEKDLTTQPNSTVKANRRAYAFKSKYVNTIIQSKATNLEKAIDENFEKTNLSFQEYITNKFAPYFGKSIGEITQIFKLTYSEQKKDKASMISKAILGVEQKNKIEEFEKADIQMKTIVLEANGKTKESMSFNTIDYKEIVDEKWFKSYFYTKVVNRKFFFVIFRKDSVGVKRLERVMFWNMPFKMRVNAEKFWKDTRQKIIDNNLDNFWRLKDHKDFHVRPKAKNAKDITTLRDGTEAKKYAYWINSKTIEEIINIDV